MKNKTKILWVGGVLLAIMLFWSYQTSSLVGKQTETLKIGVFTPLTGEASVYGEAVKKGLDLAEGELNNQGGVRGKKVELIYEDTHLDAKAAASAMKKFTEVDKLSLVIAAEGSGGTLAAAPLADQTQTIYMIPVASTDAIKDAGDYVFRIQPADSYRGAALADWVKNNGYKKAAILYVNDPYGVGIKDLFTKSFKETGQNIVAAEAFESGTFDFRTALTKIKTSNPDILVLISRKEFSKITKQASELKLMTQIITPEIVEASILQEAGQSSEGILSLDFASTTDYANFKQKYQKAYGQEPALFSDFAYDSLMVLAKAANESGSIDSKKIKNELYKVTYNGATGLIKFNSLGEVLGRPLSVYQVKGGIY